LDYTVDPSRDYMTEIDIATPPWQPDHYSKHESLAPGAAYSDNRGPRIVADRYGTEYHLPHTKYVRALSPAGNIQPLIISTCRPNPEHPDGDDGLGTDARVMAEKQRKGWLILEPDATYAGKEGDDYLAWCMAVQQHRRAIHCKHEEKAAADHENKMVKALQAQSRQQAEITSGLVEQIAGSLGKAVAEATAAAASGKRSKAAE